MPRAVLPILAALSLLPANAACAAGGAARAGDTMTSSAPGMMAGGGPTSVAGTATADTAATVIPEQLVIAGSIAVEVESIRDLVSGLRKQVEDAGGRVTNEAVSGAETSWSAQLQVRLPPDRVDAVVSWLAGRGEITSKHIAATDVSRTLFDQDLAIKNQRAALDRLQALLAQGGLSMADVLAIEHEMTRLRGEIEALEGSTRYLHDRVAQATLDISLSRRDGAVTVASAKAYPGARFVALVLLDRDGRQRVRLGGGAVVHTIFRHYSMDVEVFEEAPDRSGANPAQSVLATVGGAFYSDFLGRGERRFGNPYLGIRLGYGYLDRSRAVIQAEAGVELFKHPHAAIDASVRITGLIDGDGAEAALVLGGGAVLAF